MYMCIYNTVYYTVRLSIYRCESSLLFASRYTYMNTHYKLLVCKVLILIQVYDLLIEVLLGNL